VCPMAGEAGKASRGSARKVVRLIMYSKSTPSRRNGSKATAYGGGSLLILPIEGRVWYPNTGGAARLLPVKVTGDANGKEWEVRGVPYEIGS
ncbi:MAG TPA: hypothetical protein VJ022_14055, partial [Anaerolineales bacterium]|nr:hypothetical protein [Anaerolineales bacterium]